MWYGMISGVAGLIFRRERTSTPLASSSPISFFSAAGRKHHAVADQAQRVVAQDAGGDQVQDGLLAVDDQGMAGVVAALEAHDRADFLGQQIDDLALAFIAPLGTENDD